MTWLDRLRRARQERLAYEATWIEWYRRSILEGKTL